MKDGPAQHFIFSKNVLILMGLNYFEIKHVKNAEIPLCLLKEGLFRKCALLAAKVEGYNNHCCIVLSSDWLTLNKLGQFRVINEFKNSEILKTK